MVWGTSISLYLFLAGLGGGAFILSTFLAFRQPDARKSRLAGRVIAPVAVAVGLVFLMVDAEAGFTDPVRFSYLLTNFQSVMTWGVVILALFMIASIAVACIEIAKKRAPKWLDAVGALLGLAVATYTGVLLGAAQSTYPLWNPVVLPILFVVSALATGFAAVLLYSLAFAKEEHIRTPLLNKAQCGLTVIEAILVIVLLVTVNMSGEAGALSVAALVSGEFALVFWIAFVALGLVLPLVAELIGIRKHKTPPAILAAGEDAAAGQETLSVAIAAWIGILIGGFALRYFIIAAAVPICTGF